MKKLPEFKMIEDTNAEGMTISIRHSPSYSEIVNKINEIIERLNKELKK